MRIVSLTLMRALIAVSIAVAAGCGKQSPAPASTPGTSSQATAGEALAKAKGCLVCHGIDKANLGPSYREIAKKYAGEGGAAARLVKKVKEGGSGAWGTTPMPPQTHLTDDEAKAIVGWALSLQ